MAPISSSIIEKVQQAMRTSSSFGEVYAAYLFGSQATGSADEWSDIDVALFVEGSESWDFKQLTGAAYEIYKQCGAMVEAHFFPAWAAAEPVQGSFAEWVIKNGRKIA